MLALGLASATACAGQSNAVLPGSSAEDPGTSTTAAATTLLRKWPLTGRPVQHGLPKHGVFVVKVDNTDAAMPQVGLGSADLITEELVEGGLTRLAVFYFTDLPPAVGPVRSMRASDIGIVKPADAVLVASGAAPPTVRRLTSVGVVQKVDGAPGFYRAADRPSPYNLMLRLRTLVDRTPSKPPTRPYLPFGTGALPAGRQVTSMQAVFSPAHTTSWRYVKAKGWTRVASLAAPGDDFVADNVLVLRVRVGNAGYLDPGGNPVPETLFSGRGEAVLLHGDRAVTATWRKPSRAAQLQLSTKSGRLLVPPGNTWIELVPAKSGQVSFGN